MKNWKLLVATYCVGALITNSYVRQFRYKDWYKENPSKSHKDCKNSADDNCIAATAFWPIYASAKVSDKLVHTVATTDIKVEAPEIIKGRSPK